MLEICPMYSYLEFLNLKTWNLLTDFSKKDVLHEVEEIVVNAFFNSSPFYFGNKTGKLIMMENWF